MRDSLNALLEGHVAVEVAEEGDGVLDIEGDGLE